MKVGSIGRGVIACVLVLFFLCAGVAQAAEFTVDSTGDQPDAALGSGGCETAVGTCTLRAAIEEADASVGVPDDIVFPLSVFDGRVGDAIALATPLPTITRSTTIIASGPCETEYLSIPGPCVGIDGPPGGTAFRVASDEEVEISGVAIYGAKVGVETVGARLPVVRNSWFGLRLDGSADPLETGILLDQGTWGAYLGGVYPQGRDVFAHDHVGINIDGADTSEIRGDFFGVMPNGTTAAPNGTDIVVADAATGDDRVARDNVIGRTVGREEQETTICDGGCNVIDAAEGSGIDLSVENAAEDPATGANRIIGNYIGLDALGTASDPDAEQGVRVGSAENVTIGGPWPGDRNLLNGGPSGIVAGPDADNLLVEGDWLGLNPAGTGTMDPPTTTGIALSQGFYPAAISENRISMGAGTAIEDAARPSVIRSNTIGEGVTGEELSGGQVGVRLTRTCGECALVHGNGITQASEFGVLVEGDSNEIFGNRIEASGQAGVRVGTEGHLGDAFYNVIGGNSPEEENTISYSGGPAIELVYGPEFAWGKRNEVARNRGAENRGPFISLINRANGWIGPPQISGATESGAAGAGAMPNATIRVFRKADPSPGELEGFLAETVADATGDWSVSYPSSVPAGTMVAASQSTWEEGTSELAFATTTAPPGGGGSTGGGSGIADGAVSKGEATPPPVQTPPSEQGSSPQTTILQGPPKRSHATAALFRFSSDDSSAQFRCELDGGRVTDCRSPKIYRNLKSGKHVFEVWAVSGTGQQDPTPARWAFSVERRSRRAS